MKPCKILGLLFLMILSLTVIGQIDQNTMSKDPGSRIPDHGTGQPHPGNWVLVIHGGAGGPPPGTMAQDKEDQYKEKLQEALTIGSAILQQGGSSMDAVEAVIRFMEDCPLFNAGKGAVFNDEGVVEMDASIMDGSNGMAGAVTGVKTIRHPVTAARKVMTETRHVLLMGTGAEAFALDQELVMEEPEWFLTQGRKEQYEKMKEKELEGKKSSERGGKGQEDIGIKGTVGAVARDNMGNLAAATSTGGLMMKMKGRIGDTPIIGAGTYANNATCAVSCTGTGEYFMRDLIAYDASALMEYKGWSLKEAADYLIDQKLKSKGGSGGLIAVDHEGNIAMPFNTNLMFRGYAKAKEGQVVSIY